MNYNRKVIVGAVAMTSLATAVTIGRGRIAGWMRAIANDIARRNLNVRYHTSFKEIDARAELLSSESVLNSANDPYAFIRNAYLQRREYLVKDGAMPDEELEIFEDEPAQ